MNKKIIYNKIIQVKIYGRFNEDRICDTLTDTENDIQSYKSEFIKRLSRRPLRVISKNPKTRRCSKMRL